MMIHSSKQVARFLCHDMMCTSDISSPGGLLNSDKTRFQENQVSDFLCDSIIESEVNMAEICEMTGRDD